MFFQTVLQSLFNKKRKQAGLDPALQTGKPPSPLVQKILAEMRKHSASKQSQSTMKDKEIDQEPKS